MKSGILVSFALVSVVFFTFSVSANYSFPKTIEEKRREESGSIFGADGLVIRPNTFGKNIDNSKINKNTHSEKYDLVWNAAKDFLSNWPLTLVDRSSGIILTDWYSNVSKPSYSMKIQATISSDMPDLIEVKVFERTLISGQWYNKTLSDSLSRKFKDDILSRIKK